MFKHNDTPLALDMNENLYVEAKKGHRFVDITNHKYNRLTALYPTVQDKKGSYKWMCKCDCGTEKEIGITRIKNGNTKSCGCLVKENAIARGKKSKKHHMTFTREYTSWRSMKERCTNKNGRGYWRYGGSGISVCDRWMKFENFYADMGNRPEGTSLDRINPFGIYEPKNCRWADKSTQAINKKSNILKERGICFFLTANH
jgi:hypothetical protein